MSFAATPHLSSPQASFVRKFSLEANLHPERSTGTLLGGDAPAGARLCPGPVPLPDAADLAFAALPGFNNGGRWCFQVQIFHNDTAGFGVIASEQIPPDSLIVEYIGDIVSLSSNDLSHKNYAAFLCSLSDDTSLAIDSESSGNQARFVNHSCSPNSCLRVINSPQGLRIGLWSSSTISPGSEILFDYGYTPSTPPLIPIDLDVIDPAPIDPDVFDPAPIDPDVFDLDNFDVPHSTPLNNVASSSVSFDSLFDRFLNSRLESFFSHNFGSYLNSHLHVLLSSSSFHGLLHDLLHDHLNDRLSSSSFHDHLHVLLSSYLQSVFSRSPSPSLHPVYTPDNHLLHVHWGDPIFHNGTRYIFFDPSSLKDDPNGGKKQPHGRRGYTSGATWHPLHSCYSS